MFPMGNGTSPQPGTPPAAEARSRANHLSRLLSADASKDGSRDGPLSAELQGIAQRVRRWREEAGFTLQELAKRSAVATSTIQKVESMQMVPTIGVLLKISRGLDRAPSELVRDTTDELEVVHLRPEERHPVGVREKMLVERLVGDLFDAQLEVWRVTHQPGSGSGRGRIRFDGEGLIVCEEGEVTFRVGDDEYDLHAGDTLHYKATLPHGWRNNGSERTRFLIIGTLPRALRSALHTRLRDDESNPA